MRFIFTHEGIAINVDHIVTIFPLATSKGDGFVVRCRTTLAGGEYTGEHQVLNLSPVLADRRAAEEFILTAIKQVIDPTPQADA